MMKLYALILSAATALSVSAANHAPADAPLKSRPLAAIAHIKDPALPDIITTPPAGTPHAFSRSGGAYYAMMGNVSTEIFEGIVADFIEGDDGSWYLLNPFSQAETNSYLRLEKTDDHTLTARLPQAITQGNVNNQTIVLYANRMNYTLTSDPGADQEATYIVDTGNNTITFTLTPEGNWAMEGGQQLDTILGLADEKGNWYGYGEFNTIFTPFTDTLLQLPEGLQPEKWAMTYGFDGHFINAAISGSDLYLQGLSTYFPDSWVKATISGSTVTLPSRQYIGIEQAYTHYCYLNGADITPVYNDYYEDYIDTFTPNAEATFNFAPDTRILTAAPSQGLIVNTLGQKIILEVQSFATPTLRPVPADMTPTPATPIITLYEPYDDIYQMGAIEFTLPVTNTDGILLDKSALYYRIYLDDTPLTLTPANYPNLTEPIQLIPYNLECGSDILVMGASHTLFFYTDSFTRLGIQTIYIAPDQTEHPSDIIYTAHLGSLTVPDVTPTVTSTRYYDLSGRPISHPTRGLYIRRTTHSDGTTNTTKIHLP